MPWKSLQNESISLGFTKVIMHNQIMILLMSENWWTKYCMNCQWLLSTDTHVYDWCPAFLYDISRTKKHDFSILHDPQLFPSFNKLYWINSASSAHVGYILLGTYFADGNGRCSDKLGSCHQWFPWASCQIPNIACCACAGNAGNVSPATDFKENH